MLRDVARVLDDAGAGESPAVLAREKELAGGMAEEGVPAPQQRSHVEVEPGHPLAAAAVQALGEVDELFFLRASLGDAEDFDAAGHDGPDYTRPRPAWQTPEGRRRVTAFLQPEGKPGAAAGRW